MAVVLGIQPHQDDFALAFAAMADQHIRAGHRVICLTVSDGLGSGAQAVTGLSDAAFTAARNDEDKRALRRLGMRYDDIVVPSIVGRGGELTAEGVALLVSGYLATELADVPRDLLWLKAYTPLDFPGYHPDHLATGRALALLEAEGIIVSPRYYVPPWKAMLDAFRLAYPTVKLTAQTATALGLPRVQGAFNEYTRRDPIAGDEGIGGLSVPKVFAELHTNPVNYWHMPIPQTTI